MNFITRTVLLFLFSCIVITLQNTNNKAEEKELTEFVKLPADDSTKRDKRAFFKKKKPGPVRQIFGIIFEQWNDTKVTMDTINELINNNFLPENASLTTTTTPNPNLNISTKPPPFKITRSEGARIFSRNLKGLARLYNIELRDALKQSKITQKEYKQNVTREIAKFL